MNWDVKMKPMKPPTVKEMREYLNEIRGNLKNVSPENLGKIDILSDSLIEQLKRDWQKYLSEA